MRILFTILISTWSFALFGQMPPPCVGTSHCPSQVVNWDVAPNSCTGTSLAGTSGDSTVVTDITAPAVGNATFKCIAGTYTIDPDVTPVCTTQCPATTLSWTVGMNTCSGSVPVTAPSGTAVATDAVPLDTGSATFTCTAGAWGAASSATCGSSGPPSNLVLTHTNNSRNFLVSWTAGSGNGGAGGCRLEYLRNGVTWTALAGTYNCDANTTSAAASFPTTAAWTNNFTNAGAGVQVRIARVSDSASMGIFPQQARCFTAAGSASSTPNTDEDCNGDWNNTSGGGTTSTAINLNFGAAYSCPNPYIDGGVSYDFERAHFQMTVGANMVVYNDLSCFSLFNTFWFYGFEVLWSASGTVPNAMSGSSMTYDSTACQVYPNNPSMGATWSTPRSAWEWGYCGYTSATTYY